MKLYYPAKLQSWDGGEGGGGGRGLDRQIDHGPRLYQHT